MPQVEEHKSSPADGTSTPDEKPTAEQKRLDSMRDAAERGDPDSQCSLGSMYVNGTGVAKDPIEAVKWFRRSAEQGNPAAQTWLGYMYFNGTGIAQDLFEAAKWYRKAADQGNATGQINLGSMYANGTGILKDSVKARELFCKAADQGNVEAKKWLEKLNAENSDFKLEEPKPHPTPHPPTSLRIRVPNGNHLEVCSAPTPYASVNCILKPGDYTVKLITTASFNDLIWLKIDISNYGSGWVTKRQIDGIRK